VPSAAVKALPMVFIDAVAGCETYNAIHFIRKGGAKTGKTVEELAEVCLLLLENDEKRAAMSQSLREMGLGNAAKTIYETMKDNAKELQEA
jgi:processive 1,2-diacylglycerol beta-glucosyltransferase